MSLTRALAPTEPATRRGLRRIAAAIALPTALVGSALLSTPAARADVPGTLHVFVRTASEGFTAWVVPPDTYSISIIAVGGSGGNGGSGPLATGGPGGHGAFVRAVAQVTPGDTLYLDPGTAGSTPGPGASSTFGPTGGSGGAGDGNASAGGGGGGSSSVKSDIGVPLALAGGGGGGGGGAPNRAGGAGGNAGASGTSGTGPAGGRAGTGNVSVGDSEMPWTGATAVGALPGTAGGGGGGGGGGWDGDSSGGGHAGGSGGSGGGAGGGGAGGLSTADDPDATIGVVGGTGDGSVSIRWTPTVATTSLVTGPDTVEQGSAATFTGTITPAIPGGPPPTGTVTFVEVDANAATSTTVLGEVPVINGQATLSSPLVDYGVAAVHALYSGDGLYRASTSPYLYPAIVAPAVRTLTVSPNPLDFGEQTVGSSATGTVTLTNTGTVPWSGSSVSATSDDVSLSTRNCTALAPGDSCTETVAFTPTAAGPVSATLSFLSNFGTSTLTVTGTGVAPQASALSITPDPVAFGNHAVGSRATRQITLTNTGNVPWSFSGATSDNAAVSLAVPPCATLAPRASCSATVAFAPTVTGPVSGTVTLTGTFGTTALAVSGTGVAAKPVVTRISPNHGPRAGGTTVTITGRNFTGVIAIRIGSGTMTSLTCTSSTTCTAVTPRSTAGKKDVRVVTPSGTSSVVAADRYTYR